MNVQYSWSKSDDKLEDKQKIRHGNQNGKEQKIQKFKKNRVQNNIEKNLHKVFTRTLPFHSERPLLKSVI